jgi:hypothetical protein
MLSIKGHQYASWDDGEFHSINANDNHEIVHFMTDPTGRPPRAIAEGTVFWLLDDFNGEPIEAVMKKLVLAKSVPSLQQMIEYTELVKIDPNITMPAAASFVGFLADRFGSAKLMELYAKTNGVNSYGPFATRFQTVYAVPLDDAERAWRSRILVSAAAE